MNEPLSDECLKSMLHWYAWENKQRPHNALFLLTELALVELQEARAKATALPAPTEVPHK